MLNGIPFEYESILSALDAMPIDRKSAFIMYHLDEMEPDEIAMALQISERKAAAELKKAQNAVMQVIEKDTGGKIPAGQEIIGSAAALFSRALADNARDAYDDAAIDSFVSRSMTKVRWMGPDEPEETSARAAKISRRPMWLKPVIASIAIAVQAIAPFKILAIFAVAAVAVSGGAAIYLSHLPDEDIGGDNIPPIATPAAPDAEETPPEGILPDGAGASPTEEVPDEPPAVVPAPPAADPDQTAADKEAFLASEAYLKAVESGAIVLSEADCHCGHVNPGRAEAANMDPERGAITWVIKKGDGAALYSGKGGTVTAELGALYKDCGDGNYIIAFTYTAGDGMTVEKERAITIDTGTITENQYE
jgi:hypothetical protein